MLVFLPSGYLVQTRFILGMGVQFVLCQLDTKDVGEVYDAYPGCLALGLGHIERNYMQVSATSRLAISSNL